MKTSRAQNLLAARAYYAPGTAHPPHHAPKDWIAKFNGKFDQGWDKVRTSTGKDGAKLDKIWLGRSRL
jgi:arylsulfatase A-like enzyme